MILCLCLFGILIAMSTADPIPLRRRVRAEPEPTTAGPTVAPTTTTTMAPTTTTTTTTTTIAPTPEPEPETTTTTTTTTTIAPSPNVNQWYTAGECGKSDNANAGESPLLSFTIVGGSETSPNEYPWLVSLMAYDGIGLSHVCGGTIINKYWVLIAAHCVHDMNPDWLYLIRTGAHNIYQPSGTETTHFIESTDVHPEWSISTLQNDIALVKVSTPFVFSPASRPLCSPNPTLDYTGRPAVVAGWGDTAYGGTASHVLQEVTLTVMGSTQCNDIYSIFSLNISPKMFCATDNVSNTQRSSCQGDSGGPLAYKTSGGNFEQVGLVSVGFGCANGYPVVYTRVAAYLDWIQPIIQAEVNL